MAPPKDASVQVALAHHIAGYGSGRTDHWVDCSCGAIYSGATTEDAGAEWGRHYVRAAAAMWKAWS